MHMSVVSIREIHTGISRLARRDPTAATRIREWADRLPEVFGARLLRIDLAVARRCGELHVPTEVDPEDAWIAATALDHGLSVATRNVVHFARWGSTWSTRGSIQPDQLTVIPRA